MIFRWLYLRRMKAPFRPYLSPEQLRDVFADVRLTEWDAFRLLVAPRRWTPPDAQLGARGLAKLNEIAETALGKQDCDSDGSE